MNTRRGPVRSAAGPLAFWTTIAATVALSGCSRYEPGHIPKAESITRDAAWDGDAAVSADGWWLAFVSERDGARGLYVRRLRGRDANREDARLLVDGRAGAVSRPSWSPDGKRVLFTRVDSLGAAPRLYLVEATSGQVRPIGGRSGDQRDGVFSPDGERVACLIGGDSTATLAIVRLADHAVRPILTVARPPSRPTFTRDGKALVYEREGQLWAVGLDEGEARPVALTPGRSREHDPAVSPDGHWLAFASDSTGYDNIWIARLERKRGAIRGLGAWRPVTSDLKHHRRPAWDRSGKSLWFDRVEPWAVFARDLEGTNVDSVSSSLYASDHPSYSPDGLHVVFESNRTGDEELWIVASAGEGASGPARQLTRHPGGDVEPDWSKASGQIAYVRGGSASANLWLTDPEGANLGSLTKGAWHDGSPRWAPDGRSVAFVSDRGGTPEIYVLEGVGRALRQVTHATPGGASSPAWTADGLGIVYAAAHQGRRSLWQLAVAGGMPVPLTGDDVAGSWDAHPAVSPDGNRVVFTRARRGNRDLWLLDLTTGEARPFVENALADEDCADWDPDGRRIAYQSGGAVDLFRADVRPLLRW